MKQSNEGNRERNYDLTEKGQSGHLIENYAKLIALLNIQIDSLRQSLASVTSTLQLYHSRACQLAQNLDLQPLSTLPDSSTEQKTDKWWVLLESKILKVMTDRENRGQTQRVVQVQRIVDRPVFIEVIKEVQRQVVKYVQRPIFVEKKVEVPIFVQKKSSQVCLRCLTAVK